MDILFVFKALQLNSNESPELVENSVANSWIFDKNRKIFYSTWLF